MDKTKVMIVSGMHRSATSGVAKGLHLAGWPMAPSEEVMIPPLPSNLWGHWEDIALVDLNDQFLHRLRSAWNNPPDPVEVEQRVGEFVTEAVRYINRRVAAHEGGQWGMKDPRLVLLWPIWRAAFNEFQGLDPIIVVPWRDEANIVSSLCERDGMDRKDALTLTRHYHYLQSIIP